MQRKTALILVFGATVLLVVMAVVGAVPAMMTPMLFDSPESLYSPATITLAISVATFPLVCILAALLSWLVVLLPAFATLAHRYLWACGLTVLPLVNVAIAGVALAWITYVNDGSLS
jgi:hypothetical protein